MTKVCVTCNASQNNTLERFMRCALCIAKPTGNTNWRPAETPLEKMK